MSQPGEKPQLLVYVEKPKDGKIHPDFLSHDPIAYLAFGIPGDQIKGEKEEFIRYELNRIAQLSNNSRKVDTVYE